MLPPYRRFMFLISSSISILVFIIFHASFPHNVRPQPYGPPQKAFAPTFDWSTRTERYPVASYRPIPNPRRVLPKAQHHFRWQRRGREIKARQTVVKLAFQRCWQAYREKAWLADELRPISGLPHDHFGGWAATLVDSLNSLWIMGLNHEFIEAVEAVVRNDYSVTSAHAISTFETTIRHLGGLLSAYDLSGDARLLQKSVELGNMLFGAFDTPNRLPIASWDLKDTFAGLEQQSVGRQSYLADIGSLSIEFTRLSQVTGNAKWYDAVARITDTMEEQQNMTTVPGLWPSGVNSNETDFHTGGSYSLGALSDSA